MSTQLKDDIDRLYIPEFHFRFHIHEFDFKSINNRFSEVVSLLKTIAEKCGISDNTNVQVVELEQGVFIRSKEYYFTMSLQEMYCDEFQQLTNNELTGLARDVKMPINDFGDKKLIRFKIGF